MNWNKITYALGAFPKRLTQPRICPSCGARASSRVDRKGFHELRRCDRCALLYRWPTESATEMRTFYQHDYKQAGLTTDLPDANGLKRLIDTGFKGSNKDFSRVIALLRAIGLPLGSRVLDFGANWGYGVWQFRQAGYDAIGYELSKPRAEFSQRLGINMCIDWCEVVESGLFDLVFSSHVLEHTPDPAQAIQDQLDVLKPGGYLIALFPNGSNAFRLAEPQAFHRLWGRVHPVMLNERFVAGTLKSHVVFQGNLCDQDLDRLRHWDRENPGQGNLAASELLIVALRSGDQKQVLYSVEMPETPIT